MILSTLFKKGNFKMNNEQILESWNLQFKDQDKLNLEEAKELLKLASKETDES